MNTTPRRFANRCRFVNESWTITFHFVTLEKTLLRRSRNCADCERKPTSSQLQLAAGKHTLERDY